MADLEQSLAELESVKQAFKTNINSNGVSTSGIEFRSMPNLLKQMEKKLPSQTKTVDPTTSEQSVSADSGYKLVGVKVNAVKPSDYYKPEEIANVTPTTSDQEINPTNGAVFSKINVSAVTRTIDGNIKEENIKKGVTILGVTGTMEATSGGSSKFTELVDGSITSVEETDLADVETIKSYAFGGCQNLASVKIPSNVKTIGDGAFEACANLQTLSLAEGIEKIGATAFAGINAPINLPSTLTEVGNSAFAGNQALTSIIIPSGLTVLSADMFAFCQNLTDVTMLATTPPIVGVDAFPENVVRIYVPYSAYDDYISSSYWTAYTSKIVRLPAKPSTITVTVNNNLGEMVSGASITITGNNQTYTGTTDSVGVFSQGDLQPATYTISVADLDGFKTPDVQEVVVEEGTQNNVEFTYLEKPLYSPIYGVSWTNDNTTTMTRTDDAVGMTYSKNTSTGKITSDFDHVFPYNQMKRQVINGNTFVYVPSMWFRVVAGADQKITSVAVSETQGEGDNWYQTRPFYYGAYGASSDGTILKSVSGASRLYSITRAVARSRAMAVGTNYHQRDLYAGTILMFLWWIEFATKNSGSVMAGTQYGKTTGNTDSIYNEEEGDNFCVSGYNTSTQQMVWRGIEDYVGNGIEWEDGITGNNTKGGEQYVSDDYTLYDDYSDGSQMSALAFNSPTTSGNCLEAIGWDETKPFLCQPIATRVDTKYVSCFCDYASTSNNIVPYRGCFDPSTANNGVSYFGRGSVSDANARTACRLMKEV